MCIDVKVTLSAEPVSDLDNRLALWRKLKGSLDDVVLAHGVSKLLWMLYRIDVRIRAGSPSNSRARASY